MTKSIREASGAIGSGASGKYRIKVIQAGPGSSAYYPREVLERDGAAAFPVGTKIYANHPTSSEEWERPERSVNDIVGKLMTEATYEDGALYADVQFSKSFTPVIEEFGDVLGMSIYAFIESEFATIGDYTGDVASSLVPAGNPNQHSVDVVTAAGAGGKILERITESFKMKESGNKTPEASSARENQEEGTVVTNEILDAINELKTQFSTILAAKTQEAQAEVDAKAIAEAKAEGIEQYDAQVTAIAEADLLPVQESALKSAVKRGEDITERLAEAKAVAKEAKELGAKRTAEAAPGGETGRVGESAGRSDADDRDYSTKGLFA